ncbi:MAG: hypothetical protein GY757_07795 [bacterium]|nr:hypothetical protein [bacterium]
MAKTRNSQRVLSEPGWLPAKIGGGTHIYEGAITCKNTLGYTVKGGDTAGLTCNGVASVEADNTTGADGDLTINIWSGKIHKFNVVGATQSWEGKKMYVIDDDTLGLTSTNSILYGVCTEFVSDTCVKAQHYMEQGG